ncbi:MAG: hypothetical protein D6689_18965 [Deltaproteobacteria bacterium]|nr:MAG: hypothetical protein D6689_18965 [Deltaproteobacteria bacterium]
MMPVRARTAAAAAAAALLAACPCDTDLVPQVDRAALDASLRLGTRYLLANQKPDGRFTYEYDWRARRELPGDNQVRQAGAMWGLALIFADEPSPEVERALRRSIALFEGLSRVAPDGARYVVYPGDASGKMGTIAIFALTLIDYLRAGGATFDAGERAQYEQVLDGLLRQLVRARRPDGHFAGSYRHADGAPVGDPNPYVDGEALLALVKAAKFLGRDDLRPIALSTARAGYWDNVVVARALHPDSDTTKGYYQWGSMAFFEIATADWPGADRWPWRVIEMAYWMIDVHHTLRRTRNTAYAYEGLIHAWELARRLGDRDAQRKIGRVIGYGLSKLTAWQVGGPIPSRCIGPPPDDPRALGGVQNHAREPVLRIDVTQHQMAAVLLARRYVYPPGRPR